GVAGGLVGVSSFLRNFRFTECWTAAHPLGGPRTGKNATDRKTEQIHREQGDRREEDQPESPEADPEPRDRVQTDPPRPPAGERRCHRVWVFGVRRLLVRPRVRDKLS